MANNARQIAAMNVFGIIVPIDQTTTIIYGLKMAARMYRMLADDLRQSKADSTADWHNQQADECDRVSEAIEAETKNL